MGKFRFSIDRGGTFTDISAELPDGSHYVCKLLSEDTANYPDAPREGIRRILEQFLKKPFPKDEPVDASSIEWIRMGTTVATNALLERKGTPTLLLASEGLGDVLQIGDQSRRKIFDLKMRKASLIYDKVVEVQERVRLMGADRLEPLDPDNRVERVHTQEWVEVLRAPDMDALRGQLEAALREGIRSVAVVFMHSTAFPEHEQLVGRLCEEVGFENVSLSSSVMPMVKIVPRGQTTCVDAYLTPIIATYLKNFTAGFSEAIKNVDVAFMMSDGGLCPMEQFRGCRSILSGPAGGVVGYAATTWSDERRTPVIGFDMGGTSTDVSRFAGQYEHVYDSEVSGVTMQAPQLDITTVAAGGGSRLKFDAGMMHVGPESVGAEPGPVCYRKGGKHLAVTDANLVLGRILPEFFPHIFGESEDQPLDRTAALAAFQQLTDEINAYNAEHNPGETLTVERVAMGFVDVANASMCRPILSITEARGFSASNHILSCFGGAGGQHACAIARNLGMSQVFVHRYSGILSAYGLGLADVVIDNTVPLGVPYEEANAALFERELVKLEEAAGGELRKRGFEEGRIALHRFLNLRFKGHSTCIMTPRPPDGDYVRAFEREYLREFGFVPQGRALIVDDVRVRAVGCTEKVKQPELAATTAPHPTPVTTTRTYFGTEYLETNVYRLKEMGPGHTVKGPAIVIDDTSTVLVEPNCSAEISAHGNLTIEVGGAKKGVVSTALDTVNLAVFSNRFMSIAEQMGKTLQRTSISTNIKERLDFSCALFGPDGGLVANAPHLPVHLGAMQEAVRWQIRHLRREAREGGEAEEAAGAGGTAPPAPSAWDSWETVRGEGWREGEVIMSNHPDAGGSHLPDITVITPVFSGGNPVFYVASRGHHADIGGISPYVLPCSRSRFLCAPCTVCLCP
eukprot:TRINITY_DN4644_c0_g1_i2.p1 TRINITY_DN4644_c0_g1~~TRINITY_DN4644_c0_g1_i2.p1  ORF type:complete len:927 (+),score=254.03 TRINITY_DN4644_c0_g1_i2:50-2782(+)